MSYLETKYISLASSQLLRFSKKKEGLYNFRCPYCGDSKKRADKARGYLFKVKNEYVFKCHNCGTGRNFSNFLKENCRHLHDQYVLERYKEGLTGRGYQIATPSFNFSTPVFKRKGPTIDLEKISDLESDHPARKYMEDRKIPNLDYFYYCPKFKEWTNQRKKVFDSLRGDAPRIIIPLHDTLGDWVGYQGRSLSPTAKLRYITVMWSNAIPKIFGLDRANFDETVYITEGPFDSMFLNNSVAMAGADIDSKYLHSSYPSCDFVYVLDNEPRNPEIVNRIDKLIQQGYSVVIWPSSIEQKDINEMVLEGIDVQQIVEQNTYSMLQAKLKLNEWKKV